MNPLKHKTTAFTLASLALLTLIATPATAASSTCNAGTVAGTGSACTVSYSVTCPAGGPPCTFTTKCIITGTGVVGCYASGWTSSNSCGPALSTCTSTGTSTVAAGWSSSGAVYCQPQNTVATNVVVKCSYT